MAERSIVPGRFACTPRGYAVTRSLAQLRRRPFANLATLLVLGIVLALPALLWFAANGIDRLLDPDATRPSITAFLLPGVPDLDGARLAAELQGRAGIGGTRYISRDEALATLADGSDLAEVIATLGDNPLPGAIVVYPDASGDDPARKRARNDAIAAELRAISSVERVQYDLAWVERLAAVLSFARVAGALLAAFLVATALLVIGNTIRLELLRRRAEREVADLLGAERAFRDRPFLYAGALYGLAGGLLAVAVAALAWLALKSPADALAALYDRPAALGWPSPLSLGLVPIVGLTLGLTGALISLYGPSRVKIREQYQ